MKQPAGFCLLSTAAILAAPTIARASTDFTAIVERVSPGWEGQVAAELDQSYAGWDVEIGDADNDGKNEILTTGCPDSRLYLFKRIDAEWQKRLLADNLAHHRPGMGLTLRVVDLNRDGKNEIILGTGQEASGPASFYIFQTDGHRLTRQLVSRPAVLKSAYTHGLPASDLDGDGTLEVVSAYCSRGEIIRYDVDRNLTRIDARKIHQLSGSGEESIIADVDNDGQMEYLTANGFRDGKARAEIFEFDKKGELVAPPRVFVDRFDGKKGFYCSFIVGDVDNDGRNELVIGWKREQRINKTTLIAYRVSPTAAEPQPLYIFAREDEDLDLGYFEKMMAIADADNDGKNELVVSTRGDEASENITSRHLGHVFCYRVKPPGPDQKDVAAAIQKELLLKLCEAKAESSWLAVGDTDNDGKNEVVLATGKGDRRKPGTSWILILKKKEPASIGYPATRPAAR